MDSYITALGESVFTQSILKSKFIAYLRHTDTEEDALSFIEEIKKRHSDATHNCYSFILMDNNISRFSDDGEPSGTAGKPIYDVIKGGGLLNVTIVVTRYFGGTLLGTGGLVRAYSSSAKGAVDAAKIVTMSNSSRYSLSFDYKYLDQIKSYVDKNPDCKISHIDYLDKINVDIDVKNGKTEDVEAKITDITSNNFVINHIQTDYLPW